MLDARSFVPEAGRIRVPDWQHLPVHGNEFVRSFGLIRPRKQGGAAPWPCEGFYVDCRNAIKFTRKVPLFLSIRSVAPKFRRLYSDGVVTRVEIGMRLRSRHPLYDPRFMSHVADELMSRLQIKAPGRDATPCYAAGRTFAESYLANTQCTLPIRAPQRWWVTEGSPLICVELHDEDIPHYAEDVARRADHIASIYQYWISVESKRVSVWLINLPTLSDREQVRRLRIHISRLHAEHESFRALLRHVSAGRIDVSAPDVAAYLDDKTRLLLKRNFGGFAQQPLLAQVVDRWSSAYEGDLTNMQSVCDQISSQALRAKVASIIDLGIAAAPQSEPRLLNATQITVLEGGAITMSDNSVHIEGNSGAIGSVVGGTGNTAQIGSISQISEALHGPLRELESAIETLKSSLSEESYAEVDDLAVSMRDELEKSTPNLARIRRIAQRVARWAGDNRELAVGVLGLALKIAAIVH